MVDEEAEAESTVVKRGGQQRPTRSIKRFGPIVTPIIAEAISLARVRALTEMPYPTSVQRQESVVHDAWMFATNLRGDGNVVPITNEHIKQVSRSIS